MRIPVFYYSLLVLDFCGGVEYKSAISIVMTDPLEYEGSKLMEINE